MPLLLAVADLLVAPTARADGIPAESLRDLASPDSDVVDQALTQLAIRGDADGGTRAGGTVRWTNAGWPRRDDLLQGPQGEDPTQSNDRGADPARNPRTRTKCEVNNQIRRMALPVLAQLKLKSPSESIRLAAAEELSERGSDEAAALLRSAFAKESSSKVRDFLSLALARFDICKATIRSANWLDCRWQEVSALLP